MAFLELRDVCKEYRMGGQPVEALRHVSLAVEAGEFVAIVGQSGSGKSTLMNLIGCLDLPTSGRYLLDGRDVSRMNDRELSRLRGSTIGFVFQGFNLIPALTALENVELPLAYRGMPRSARRQAAARALEQMGLGGRMDHRPGQMSGGQQQRVAIARALAAGPALVLADEPTGNLDSASGGEVMAVLTSLWRQGRTVLLITHDPRVAARAPRRVVIRDGRLTESGRPAEDTKIC